MFNVHVLFSISCGKNFVIFTVCLSCIHCFKPLLVWSTITFALIFAFLGNIMKSKFCSFEGDNLTFSFANFVLSTKYLLVYVIITYVHVYLNTTYVHSRQL